MGEGQGEGGVKLKSTLKGPAKALRQRSTEAESLLWKHLRAKRFKKLKFKRQEPIGKYIVDFVCYEKRIIVEVDGGQHSANKAKDHERDNWFRSEGFKVMRFWNHEVLTQTDTVLTAIMMNCFETPSPSPSPIKGEGNIGKYPS
jgi:very-short-patch-repair endonuclease